MRTLLIATALALASPRADAQAPTVAAFTSALRFSPAAWTQFLSASDSASTAWCSPSVRFDLVNDTIYVSELHQTTQAFDPPCGTDAIVLKRPACGFGFMEVAHWWLEPPRAVVAICRTEDGVPHFIAAQWPLATRGIKVEEPPTLRFD